MRLAGESQDHLKAFLREHLCESQLDLPQIIVHTGYISNLLTKASRVAAITFGHHVFVSPNMVERRDTGELCVPGWLIAHEAVHVWQYKQAGYGRFLASYLIGYWRALKKGRKWGREARLAAYLAIKEECAAQEAELAYAEWRERAGRRRGVARPRRG